MNQLIFEISRAGRRASHIPTSDTPHYELPKPYQRMTAPRLPEVAEVDLVRHYMELSRKAHGVDNGFYPLGSCTMKYNPRVNEDAANLSGFTDVHPLQPKDSIQGSLKVMRELSNDLCAITGMDAFTLQPAAGAHGEFTSMLMVKAYHMHRGDTARTKVIIPDSAHGTNPASANMAGFEVVSVASNERGGVDLDALRAVVGTDTAALMLTNPNTLGLFDENIREITRIVHEAGGLAYYDGANLNAIMGIVRPGDMGFDIVHLNLHKTFATPHGGGGPGSGPVGCKEALRAYLPQPVLSETGTQLEWNHPESIGQMKAFYGNFLVCVKALTYIKVMGADGLKEASANAVLNANYLKELLAPYYPVAYQRPCMHEFVVSLQKLKEERNISAKDVSKALLDFGIHPPTMYFPLIVHEALMFEPTETESVETLERAAEVLQEIYQQTISEPEIVQNAPHHTPVRKLDEVQAARHPVLRYPF